MPCRFSSCSFERHCICWTAKLVNHPIDGTIQIFGNGYSGSWECFFFNCIDWLYLGCSLAFIGKSHTRDEYTEQGNFKLDYDLGRS